MGECSSGRGRLVSLARIAGGALFGVIRMVTGHGNQTPPEIRFAFRPRYDTTDGRIFQPLLQNFYCIFASLHNGRKPVAFSSDTNRAIPSPALLPTATGSHPSGRSSEKLPAHGLPYHFLYLPYHATDTRHDTAYTASAARSRAATSQRGGSSSQPSLSCCTSCNTAPPPPIRAPTLAKVRK